jgi:hypothetical protein
LFWEDRWIVLPIVLGFGIQTALYVILKKGLYLPVAHIGPSGKLAGASGGMSTAAKALAYLEEYDITYFNGPDLGTRISQAYRMDGVPETYYLSKNGELSGLKIGPLASPELDQVIDELLAEPYPGN